MKELVALKVGGSVITDKDNYASVDKAALGRVVLEAAVAIRAGVSLVVVHGAGSFGHVKAKKHGLKDGFETQEQKQGFAETHYDVIQLNQLVCGEFLSIGVPAIGVHPLEIARQKNKRLTSLDASFVRRLLDHGFTPVIPGDVVLDDELNGSICSGDQSLPWLAKELKAKRVVVGTDVDGICTADPKTNKDAKLIPAVTKENLGRVLASLEEAKTQDVTGGMKGKIMELLALAETAPVTIVNAGKEGRLKDALLGRKVVGTTIS